MAIPFETGLGLTWLNQIEQYDAGELRRADGALLAGASGTPWGGIARHSDTAMNVTVDGSDVVTVNPGAVVIPGNAVTQTGVYRASLSALQTGALAARHATNPRITLVIFRALDTDVVVGHGAYKGRIEFVDGTPGAVPSAPALPTMAVELARITVPQTGGGAASVDLTYRTFATAAGGVLVVPTAARLPASAAKYQQARTLDNGTVYTWTGTVWSTGAWTAYTPVWGGGSTLGNGTVVGAYDLPDNGMTVHVRAQVTIGSTTVVSASSQTLSLPFLVKANSAPVFRGEAYDANAGGSVPVNGVTLSGVTDTVILLCPSLTAGGFDRTVKAGTPFVYEVGDRVSIHGTFERA